MPSPGVEDGEYPDEQGDDALGVKLRLGEVAGGLVGRGAIAAGVNDLIQGRVALRVCNTNTS